MRPLRLLVIAKEPRPGHVKTRLCPPFTPQQAAELAEAALTDTLEAARDAAARLPAVRPVLVLDGTPGSWLPPGVPWVPQVGGPLDARLAAAVDRWAGEPVLLVGMDTPQLTGALLAAAVAATRRGAALGAAADGGWWALGLPSADGRLLRGVPTSTASTGRLQRRRLVRAGLPVADLPVLRDVDTADDARAVAAGCPGTRFGALLARIDRPAA